MHKVQQLTHIFILLVFLLSPLQPVLPNQKAVAQGEISTVTALYRARIALKDSYQSQYLQEKGITILDQGNDWALVLVDDMQLEQLARLRFEPGQVDELGQLIEQNADETKWLEQSLQPLLQKGEKLVQLQTSSSLAETSVTQSLDEARTELQTALKTLSPTQQAGISTLSSVDDDGDGLTNTQEQWWCTDSLNPDSDGDGTNDGAEVQAAKDWMANRRSSPPASGKPFAGWPPQIPNCHDDDNDDVPDMAERWELGLNMNNPSTDHDRYYDGMELFGFDHTGTLPSYVKAPGKHPLVAAYPIVEIDVVPSSLHMAAVTTVTTDHTISQGTERSYSTAKTEGTSTSVANTETWNEWQEVSTTNYQYSSLSGLATRTENTGLSLGLTGSSKWIKSLVGDADLTAQGAAQASGSACGFSLGCIAASGNINMNNKIDSIFGGLKFSLFTINVNSPDAVQKDAKTNLHIGPAPVYAAEPEDQRYLRETTVGTQDWQPGGGGVRYQQPTSGPNAGKLLVQQFYEVKYPAMRSSETATKGQSHGGARTTTTEQYEEHTITNGEAFSSGESWGTATAVDSSHAADMWFSYEVKNIGTDYARQICNVAFNVYIGDDPNPATTYFVSHDLDGDGCFHNFEPGEGHKYSFPSSSRIRLTLEQMKAIDLGGTIRIVVEDYTLGSDDYYRDDALGAGVLVAIEDGIEDGDEAVDTYLIPTWGTETVLDVLARYFPHTTDADGNLIAIWTPEYRSDTPTWCNEPQRVGTTLWCKHALSTADWWNVYTSGLGDGSEGFQDTPAAPGSVALFRFNQDSDLDGYSDRSEERLGTDPYDPASYPKPELIAGVHSIRVGNAVTATLSLLNTGLYDAYGMEAVMIAPDDSVSITNNTVGGSGRVRAQKQVVVGSRILLQSPLPPQWTQSGHAVPAAGGYYTGQTDRTYTFTVQCGNPGGCDVGAGTWSLTWNDGAGASSTLNFGAGYASPTFRDVGTLGLKLALYTGKVFNGESFTVSARTPRDTFQYTINHEPYTEPIIIVSYNDPQGNHRFITPVHLSTPTENLASHSGQMLHDPGVEIVTQAPFTPGQNQTHLIINNPSPSMLVNSHLFLEFIDPNGTVVQEVSETQALVPGPNIVPISWNTNVFNPAYNPDQDYIVMAFWTDYQGNILDTAARPLSSFQQDPQPESQIATEDLLWDFGTAQQGTLLQKQVTLASSGFQDLLTYLGNAISITVDGPASLPIPPADTAVYTLTVNTQFLPLGDFSETLPIRTSDPDHPTRNITIRGNITAMPPDSPGGATLRPLDWSAVISGSHNQGEWVEFTHTLGPDPQTLHPVKVYSQDYGKLWGVGKYATPFSQGTASYDMFGDGRDGDLVISSNTTFYPIDSSCSGSQGTNTLYASNAAFQAGQKIMIHQTRGTNAGVWEINQIASYTSGVITTEKPLQYTYTDGGASQAQVLVLRQYHNVTVNSGATWTVKAWDGNTGGILGFLANGTVSINGIISANGGNGTQAILSEGQIVAGGVGGGFRGGAGKANNANSGTGFQGEGTSGEGGQSINANGNGGGGGNSTGAPGAEGGGGGGHSILGQAGQDGGDGNPGQGGMVSGNSVLSIMTFGGGGGGGGREATNSVGSGGSGGGIILISVNRLTLYGNILSNGGNAGIANGRIEASGGGGAGGSILIRTNNASLGSNNIKSIGGLGNGNGNYGIGSSGRVHIEYCDEIYGNTEPAASTQKLNCYMAEQVESDPYTTTRLNLPETFSEGRTYQVQYDRRLVFGGSGEQTTILRVPAGMASNVTLDSLISQVGAGSLTFRLDIGNDDSWDWEYTGNVTDAATLNNPSLTNAFNAYWATHGAPRSGTLDVPVKVSLSKSGEVMLTNLQMTAISSKLRQVRLAAADYSQLTLDVQVGQSGSGAFTVAADVGDDGSVDWTFSGNSNFPAHLRTANLATAFNAYLSGRSGEVDVPIRFFVEPDLALTIQQYHPTLSAKADATLSAADISFGSSNPVEGDTVGVTVHLQNSGSVDSGRIMAAFYATAAGWGEWYVGSVFVPNIPAGGSAVAEFQWNTEGFHGDVPLRVVIDPYQRLSESNETNNSAVKNLAIRTRPDLEITQIRSSDDEPMAGEMVNVILQVQNNGQAAAGSQTVVLYQGNPDSGGSVIGSSSRASIPGGGSDTVTFTWTPTTPGPYRLFAQVDTENMVKESQEENNEAWQDIYIGLPSPILLDSGTSGDVPYNTVRGYGVIDEGQADELSSCGSQPYQTLRRDPSGKLVYQFDHLLPGHFYHLDLILYECDQAGRVESIKADEALIAEPEDLSDGRVHSLSLRLDPAFYRNDHSVRVTIEAPGIDGAVVGAINLYDVDYRYADAGGSNDPQYPSTSERKYGWLDGVANTAWGILPYQSVRVDQSDNTLRYRFDQMEAAKSYQLSLTIWQPSGAARIQKVQIDSVDTDLSVNSGDYQVHRLTMDVPKSAYSNDGSIIVSIVRTNASTGAFVNEIALEEKTVTAESLPPVADFDASPISGYAPLTVHFMDKSSGTITSRLWDFGDGSTDTTTNPVHSYQTAGSYSVTLNVTGPGGEDTKTMTNLINVTAVPPTATVVKVTPPSAIGSIGVPITVTVAISNVTSLGSFQFTLNYDAAKIAVQNIRIAEFPSSTGRSFTPAGPNIDNTKGEASFGGYSLGATPPGASGSGGLAYIRILPIASGTTNLQLSSVQVTNVAGSLISILTQNGVMQILSCTGDFDGDGDVDILDVQRVAYRWNSHTGDALYDVLYDVDKDGDIDIVDIQSVAYHWGTRCSGSASVPASLTETLANASLGIDPQDGTVTAGQVITRSVVITNAEDLGAFEFTLGYNPQLLEVQSVTLGTFPGSSGRTFSTLGPVIDGSNGKVSFGAYSVGNTPNGASGNGVLAIVILKALASGSATLSFDAGQVSNRMGSSQPITAMAPARVTILPPKYVYLPLIMK